jgi:hypothetical protein
VECTENAGGWIGLIGRIRQSYESRAPKCGFHNHGDVPGADLLCPRIRIHWSGAILCRRSDAFTHIGLSTAAITLWAAWSIGIVALVVAGVFGRRWLISLLLPVICIFYLIMCPFGYLDDLEHFMLSPKQQERIGVPILTE